jgi:hypothetical protein
VGNKAHLPVTRVSGRSKEKARCKRASCGVADGTRTHDNRNHNLRREASVGAAAQLNRGKNSGPLDRSSIRIQRSASHASNACSQPIPDHRQRQLSGEVAL